MGWEVGRRGISNLGHLAVQETVLFVTYSVGGGDCYWPLAGRGQGCFWAACTVWDSPITKTYLAQCHPAGIRALGTYEVFSRLSSVVYNHNNYTNWAATPKHPKQGHPANPSHPQDRTERIMPSRFKSLGITMVGYTATDKQGANVGLFAPNWKKLYKCLKFSLWGLRVFALSIQANSLCWFPFFFF